MADDDTVTVRPVEGRRYKMRNGRTIGPVERMSNQGAEYPFRCGAYTWMASGRFDKDVIGHEYDLVEDLSEASPTLQLREGARYIARDGRRFGPISRDETNSEYPWTDGNRTWTANGRYHRYEPNHACDLVEEHTNFVAVTQLREGGYYRDRDGRVVGPITANTVPNAEERYAYPWMQANVQARVNEPGNVWTNTGNYWQSGSDSPRDLVEEVEAPVPAAAPLNQVDYTPDRNSHYYKLNDDHQPVGASLEEYVRWKAFTSRWVVQYTHGNGMFLSTVFLGYDHNYTDDGPPLLFETVLYHGDNTANVVDRYATWDEAVKGHNLYAVEYGVRGKDEPVQPVATPKGRKVRL